MKHIFSTLVYLGISVIRSLSYTRNTEIWKVLFHVELAIGKKIRPIRSQILFRIKRVISNYLFSLFRMNMFYTREPFHSQHLFLVSWFFGWFYWRRVNFRGLLCRTVSYMIWFYNDSFIISHSVHGEIKYNFKLKKTLSRKFFYSEPTNIVNQYYYILVGNSILHVNIQRIV